MRKKKSGQSPVPYLRIPKSVLAELCSTDEYTHNKAKVHVVLMIYCYHSDGFHTLKGRSFPCKRGEFYGTYEELAQKCRLKNTTQVRRLVNELAKEKKVQKKRVIGGICIYLSYYVDYLDSLDKLSKGKSGSSGLSVADIE